MFLGAYVSSPFVVLWIEFDIKNCPFNIVIVIISIVFITVIVMSLLFVY